MNNSENLLPLVRKLSLWTKLLEQDRIALLALPHMIRRLSLGEFIVREDEYATHCCLLLSGYAARQKMAGNGSKQIFSLHMRGDITDLHNAILHRADHDIQTLTAADVAMIPVEAIRGIAVKSPTIGRAMWYETLVDASIAREWAINLGRRDARQRTAHLLCEFAVRMSVAGLGGKTKFDLPMTQEQLGDALGLTPVHVNRTLMSLAEEKLIERKTRSITILDYSRISRVADFDDGYLHFDSALVD